MSTMSVVGVAVADGQPITVVWTAVPLSVADAKVVSLGGSLTPNSGGGGGNPTGGAGGVLSGSYPNPGFAVNMATQAELDTHVNSETPHLKYDDMPSLTLLFESRLV